MYKENTVSHITSERILIFRPDNIGDVFLFSGALAHIRMLYPQAHITLAVQAHILNLVELCPYVDSCISVGQLFCPGNGKALNKLIKKISGLFNISRPSFDEIIYPVRSPSESQLRIIHDLGIKKIYGIIGCDANAPEGGFPSQLEPRNLFSDYWDVSCFDVGRHELLTTLDFIRFLGCNVSSLEEIKPQLWLLDSEKNHLENITPKELPIIGLFPGGSFLDKCWHADNYYELTRLIGKDVIYVLFGSLADKDCTSHVELQIRKACMDSSVVNLVGRTTLRELAKSISECDLFIGMDSAGLHIAIASGVPTIGIVTGAHYNRFIPWGNPGKNFVLTKPMACFQCNWKCDHGDIACLQEVRPSEVAYAAKKLLGFN